jgi:hypothetical protein
MAEAYRTGLLHRLDAPCLRVRRDEREGDDIN